MTSREQAPTWRKSSYSDAQGNGACVEAMDTPAGAAVRDSKSGDDAGALRFTGRAWHAFLRTERDT